MTSQITVSTADGRSFSRPVDRDEFAVGRDSRNHLVLGDRQVSKFHCQIVKRDHGFAVKDLNSSNGTLINGIRSDGEVLISTGDRIRVGPYELVFAEDEDGLPGYLQAKAPSPVPSTFDPAAEAPQDLDVSDLLDPVGGEAPPPTDQGPQFNHALDVTDPRVASSAGTPVAAEGAPGSGLTPREGHAYLEIVDGDGKGHMITVGSRGVNIGAGSRNNLVLDDPFVSRQHARVDMEGGRYLVKDMGSTNGIRVDSQDVAQAELTNGTRLQVGGVLMLFRRPGESGPAGAGVAAAAPPPLPPSGHPTQALTPGPPSRSGRTAATMREMSALPPSAQNSTTLGPQTQAPAAPARPRPAPAEQPSGVVAIGNLKFRYWQVAILGAIGVFLVLALVWQAAQYAFNFGSGLEQRDMEPVFQAGLTAYGIQDWDTAEQYFAQITDIDPRHQDALTQMENIARERDNMSRYEDAQRFVAAYTLSKKHEDFTQAYDAHKSIPATSFYFAMAKALVEPLVPLAAQRLVDQAFVQLEAEDMEGALRLLDEAEVYDPDVAGTDELRGIADIKNRRKRAKAIEEYRANLGRDLEAVASEPAEDDAAAARERERERDRDRDSGRSDRNRDRGGSSGKEVGSQAISTYTSGDVDSARAMLQRAIDATSDPGEKLELQDVLGRVDYVERKFAAGKRAMDSGDLDSALNSFEAAYKKITQMDSSSGNERRNDIKQALAECRYRRGRAAFDQGKYAKANFEWRSGKKAWSGHSGISKGRKELEEVAKGYFNEGYLAEREGTSAGTDDAREAYEKVMAIAPKGDGFAYYEKAASRLAGL